ncbi:unnamed protein product [Phytomonas sp. Hart1]|nr:unnamed protein product [Phytomonas sp. Hart1]|eukprot:CCW66800.1 unnamed protein product [Phytomonas sp. isolate Hart1]
MTPTNPTEWAQKVRARTPSLLELGKAVPKLVLSFGGCGFLVTYSLGVALYLQQERKALLAESVFLGAGSGVLPALALACGPAAVNLEHLLQFILDNRFAVTDEAKRLEVMTAGIHRFLPSNALELVGDRLALTIGFSNRDPGYLRQPKANIHFGHHIARWEDWADLGQNLLAATAPNTQRPMTFRGASNVLRGTMMSLSSELDQCCRHVYIHGYIGFRRNKNQARHNILIGRHGFLGNTHFSFPKQALLAFMPVLGGEDRKEELQLAYDAGYHDARRYERWEEDPYFFAKADRSPCDDFNFRTLRAGFFGGKRAAEKWEL